MRDRHHGELPAARRQREGKRGPPLPGRQGAPGSRTGRDTSDGSRCAVDEIVGSRVDLVDDRRRPGVPGPLWPGARTARRRAAPELVVQHRPPRRNRRRAARAAAVRPGLGRGGALGAGPPPAPGRPRLPHDRAASARTRTVPMRRTPTWPSSSGARSSSTQHRGHNVAPRVETAHAITQTAATVARLHELTAGLVVLHPRVRSGTDSRRLLARILGVRGPAGRLDARAGLHDLLLRAERTEQASRRGSRRMLLGRATCRAASCITTRTAPTSSSETAARGAHRLRRRLRGVPGLGPRRDGRHHGGAIDARRSIRELAALVVREYERHRPSPPSSATCCQTSWRRSCWPTERPTSATAWRRAHTATRPSTSPTPTGISSPRPAILPGWVSRAGC